MRRAGKRSTPAHVRVARDDDQLGPGDVVTLPDGGVAAIDKIVGSDAYVIEWQKPSGRGPWIFPVGDLVRLS